MKFILLCILLFACSFSGNAIHFFNGTYEEALQLAKKEKKNLFISFTASWCGPCRMLAPILEEAEKELEGKVTVCKLDVDACPIAASKFSVMTIPTLVLFKDGKEVSREIGLMPKQKIIELTHRA